MQGSTALAASSSPSTAKPPLPPASSTPRRWCLLSKTTPSALSPLPGGANVGLETVRLLESDDGHRLLLLCTVLVRNISLRKNLVAVYTTDGCATMGGTVGVDRFSLEIEIDATKLPPSPQRQVSIEFALKCMMGGSEFWDNRGGANHVIEAVEVAATATTPTPATPRRASLTLDGEALKAYAAASKAAAEYAARLGEAMAADAVRISNEFQRKPVVSLIPAAAAPPSQPFQQQQPVRSVVVVKKTNGFGGNFGGTPFVGVEMPFSASPPFPYYGDVV
ncbi:hypothetical protein BC829DRAFT_491180 [Chytridium lagenaria]|nr:hypothetical protein BC829DRAFT_491180 [Chytridium lagenaria]